MLSCAAYCREPTLAEDWTWFPEVSSTPYDFVLLCFAFRRQEAHSMMEFRIIALSVAFWAVKTSEYFPTNSLDRNHYWEKYLSRNLLHRGEIRQV